MLIQSSVERICSQDSHSSSTKIQNIPATDSEEVVITTKID